MGNEVFREFLLIDIKSPDTHLCHILDGTLNPKLQANNFLSMNNTTLQVLARATPHFNIRIGNKDTNPWAKPWSIRNKKWCSNCKTVVYNKKTCPKPLDEARNNGNHHPCFDCKTVGCHFQNYPQPIDEERCKRNKTLFFTSMNINTNPSLKILLLYCPGIEPSTFIDKDSLAGSKERSGLAWNKGKTYPSPTRTLQLAFSIKRRTWQTYHSWDPTHLEWQHLLLDYD